MILENKLRTTQVRDRNAVISTIHLGIVSLVEGSKLYNFCNYYISGSIKCFSRKYIIAVLMKIKEKEDRLLAGTNFSVLVVCCIWQVLILAFLKD